ncbi:heavy-metal-associated domain-containing protein [Desulfococcaceae bacterium HSG8]|nr:heavy-metal-associated domain-containing protein [Desulfococcaceae bacterium HSG8]
MNCPRLASFIISYILKLKKERGIMEKQTFSVLNISCGHCVTAIRNELDEMEGVSGTDGDPGNKTISVEWDSPATLEKITDKLKEINYPVS